jgi:5-methylcytosine-specific restriction endonuclease McrA
MPYERPDIRANTRLRVKIRDRRCRYCGKRWVPGFSGHWEIDHIWPVSLGGKNRDSFWKGNLALACRDCNRSKSNHVGDPWIPSPVTNFQQVLSFCLAIALKDIPIKGEDY